MDSIFSMDLSSVVSDAPLSDTIQLSVEGIDAPNKSVKVPMKDYLSEADSIVAVPVDVNELPTAYEFIIEMPGLKSSDIKVQVEDDVLVITGEKVREIKKGERRVKTERSFGNFMRRFRLPENLNMDAICARYKDGVSTITIPKLPPRKHKKPKITEVKFH